MRCVFNQYYCWQGAYKNKKNIERKPPNGGKKPALVASGMKESVVAPTQQTKFADNIENLCLRPLNPADGDTEFLGMVSENALSLICH